jgi:hypothetical protein
MADDRLKNYVLARANADENLSEPIKNSPTDAPTIAPAPTNHQMCLMMKPTTRSSTMVAMNTDPPSA